MRWLVSLLFLVFVSSVQAQPEAKLFKAAISAIAVLGPWAVDGYDCTMTVSVVTGSIDAQAEGADQPNGAFDVEWVFDDDLAAVQSIHDFARVSRRQLNVTQCNNSCAGVVTLTCWPY